MGTQLGTLVTNVGVKLSDPNLRYFTSGEIKKAIGDSYRYYVMKYVSLADGYFVTSTNLDTLANDERMSVASLSPPFLKISQLWRYVTSGLVPSVSSEQRFDPIYTIGVGSGDAYRPKHRLRGQNIILIPPPVAAQTNAFKLEYVYIPTFPTSASADSFTFDANFPTFFEVNVEIRAAIKALESKDAVGGVSDISTFRAELNELDKAFEDISEDDEYPDSVQYRGINYSNGGY